MKTSFLIIISVFGVLLTFYPAFAVHKIADDFQVNENVGTSLQRSLPAVAGDKNGCTIFAWADSRNETIDVFFQRYDASGNAIGKNTRVNSSNSQSGTIYLIRPAIAMNESGQFCIVWASYHDENFYVNYQRYAPDGNQINGNEIFKVTAGDGTMYGSCIAMDTQGNFIIAWWRGNGYFQRFDQYGNPLGEIICVNPGFFSTNYIFSTYYDHVDISMDSHGNFVLAWFDQRNGTYQDVFCQLYSATGEPQGDAFQVNDDRAFNQINPEIAHDANDSFVITWMDERNGVYASWAQCYDSDAHPIGKNFQIGYANRAHVQTFPHISRLTSGQFVVVWNDEVNGGKYILGQLFTSEGQPQGDIIYMTDKKEKWILQNNGTAVKMDEQGYFVVGWMEQRDGCWGLYFSKYLTNGQILISEIKVNDDIGGNPQTNPVITMDKNGDFTIVWQDYRNSWSRIWCQSYDRRGFGNSNAFRISADFNADESKPQIAIVEPGKIAVLWNEYYRGEMSGSSRYLQLYTLDGFAVLPIVKLEKIYYMESDKQWSIAGGSNGRFIIVWREKENIMCQYYDSLGQSLGEVQQVNDETAKISTLKIWVEMNVKNEAIICWGDERMRKTNLYFQRFDSDGRAVGDNTPVWDTVPALGNISVAMADNGCFVIAWLDNARRRFLDVFYRRYDSNWNFVETNVLVNDHPPARDAAEPEVAMDEKGNFVIVWQDKRNGINNGDIYCQRYYSDGTPVGTNFRVNGDNTKSEQTNPDVAFKNDVIATTWQTLQNEGQSWDVYANFIQFSEETAVDNRCGIPASFDLLQNHPNPFNAQTAITFTLPTSDNVNLTVYNLLGQKVEVLLDGEMAAGQHRMHWDAVNVKSGIYFCRLTTSHKNFCRKMIVVK